jgi:hypothetical protein
VMGRIFVWLPHNTTNSNIVNSKVMFVFLSVLKIQIFTPGYNKYE